MPPTLLLHPLFEVWTHFCNHLLWHITFFLHSPLFALTYWRRNNLYVQGEGALGAKFDLRSLIIFILRTKSSWKNFFKTKIVAFLDAWFLFNTSPSGNDSFHKWPEGSTCPPDSLLWHDIPHLAEVGLQNVDTAKTASFSLVDITMIEPN